MMVNGLVSIITPCYNCENDIHRLMDSILIQDYPKIEMLAVDDGSTDNTKEIIESYLPKFQEKGYKLTYLYQDNAGQAAAVNRGLKLVTGEYLTWIDSDDYYQYHYSISTMIQVLRQTDDSYGMMRCCNQFIDEDTLFPVAGGFKYTESERLFPPFLTGEEFGGGAGVYMIKMCAFDEVVSEREIYMGRKPQNCQLLEPLFYTYKCKTINDSLINILVRKESHSHKKKSYKSQLDDIQSYLDIHTNTLTRMSCLKQSELDNYLHIVDLRFLNDKLTLALNFNQCKDARRFAKELKEKGGTLSQGKRIKLMLSYFPPILRMAKWLQKRLFI